MTIITPEVRLYPSETTQASFLKDTGKKFEKFKLNFDPLEHDYQLAALRHLKPTLTYTANYQGDLDAFIETSRKHLREEILRIIDNSAKIYNQKLGGFLDEWLKIVIDHYKTLIGSEGEAFAKTLEDDVERMRQLENASGSYEPRPDFYYVMRDRFAPLISSYFDLPIIGNMLRVNYFNRDTLNDPLGTFYDNKYIRKIRRMQYDFEPLNASGWALYIIECANTYLQFKEIYTARSELLTKIQALLTDTTQVHQCQEDDWKRQMVAQMDPSGENKRLQRAEKFNKLTVELIAEECMVIYCKKLEAYLNSSDLQAQLETPMQYSVDWVDVEPREFDEEDKAPSDYSLEALDLIHNFFESECKNIPRNEDGPEYCCGKVVDPYYSAKVGEYVEIYRLLPKQFMDYLPLNGSGFPNSILRVTWKRVKGGADHE